ncbi:hypothetical protein EPO15_00250 [bacterium]|nr:MAG: hypothetical protein EPO15_00250 [bacterium]
MDKKTRLALLSWLLAAPLSAQNRARVQTPTVPVIGGSALSGVALAGLRAPSLGAPALPTLAAPSVMPKASVLPAVQAFSPIVSARAAVMAAPTGAASAALPEAPKAAKPGLASLEDAAKPFADSLGRTSPEASASLGTTFDASLLQRADEAASVIPGVRNWPRVAGVGLAAPFNGVNEEKKAPTPAPKKADDEKSMGKWERIGTGLLLALCLAGSLFAWYTLYASMGQVMQMGEQQMYQQYYGPVPTIDEIFGGR